MAPRKIQGSGIDVGAVLAERQKTHGNFQTHATIAQSLKLVLHTALGWKDLDDDMKESLEMQCHKMARILNGNPAFADHWVDIAGYSKLVGDRLEKP